MKYLFLALFLLTGIRPKAQTTSTFPPVYELKTDTIGYHELNGKYWQLFVDTVGRYSFEQATRLKFKPAEEKNIHFDYASKVLWTRYRIKNTLNHPVVIFIPGAVAATASPSIDRVAVYAHATGGKWEQSIAGKDVPWSRLSGFRRAGGFYYTITPGTEYAFYQQLYNPRRLGDAAAGFNIVKSIPSDLAANYERLLDETKMSAFFLGFSLLTALVSIFFFYTAREKVYLYFSLLNIFFGIVSSRSTIYDSFFKETPAILSYTNLAAILVLYFLWRFVSAFYRTGGYFPRWTKISDWLSYSQFLTCIAIFFNTPPAFEMFLLFIVVIFGVNLTAFLITSIVKNRDELYFNGLTVLPLLLCALLNLAVQTLYPDSALRDFLVKWSIIIPYYWMVIMFLLKLVMRYKILQQKILGEALEREKLSRENEMEKGRLIAGQKIELERQVAERTAELHQSLIHLKQTQGQLIQAEKMASLGELTAGIAHEIQNPLNFVNNFSEVSVELLTELKEEAQAGHTADVLAIADDLTQNLAKIHHHGKRADSIVKGMLEHSRASTGNKEPTDINKLADEYLRLAYHGIRAKDKSFNTELITSFDERLPAVAVIPQDIGRVLLNVFNNAFYAMQQKQKTTGSDYRPTIEVTTLQTENEIQIKIKDNGLGIPDSVRDKIMQPFFTTKPTGEGTGLGLSLSYDIISKGHGGRLDVESIQGEGSVFSITIPAK